MTAAEVATYNRPLADDEVACVDCDGLGETERWVQCGRCLGFGTTPSATGER